MIGVFEPQILDICGESINVVPVLDTDPNSSLWLRLSTNHKSQLLVNSSQIQLRIQPLVDLFQFILIPVNQAATIDERFERISHNSYVLYAVSSTRPYFLKQKNGFLRWLGE